MEARLAKKCIMLGLIPVFAGSVSLIQNVQLDTPIENPPATPIVEPLQEPQLFYSGVREESGFLRQRQQDQLIKSILEAINPDIQEAFPHRFSYIGSTFRSYGSSQRSLVNSDLESHLIFDTQGFKTNQVAYHIISSYTRSGELIDLTLTTNSEDLWDIYEPLQQIASKPDLTKVDKDQLIACAFNVTPQSRIWTPKGLQPKNGNNPEPFWQSFGTLVNLKPVELQVGGNNKLTLKILK